MNAMITYVIPTRDRHDALARTLHAIAALGPHDAELIIADNASSEHVSAPRSLTSGLPVRTLRLDRNHAAAARNHAANAADPRSGWLIMLDDDSWPLSLGHLDAIREAPTDVAAIAAEIFLTPRQDGSTPREDGGLPEVFIGCGAAIRADLFRDLGGYDPSFEYYAEEYDLAARMILRGFRIAFDRRFQVAHDKSAAGRDFSRIVRNLVRNNCWTAHRYAPDAARQTEIDRHIARYRAIAAKECATAGFDLGTADLAATLAAQPRTPMTQDQWDLFTGLAACRAALDAQFGEHPPRSAAIVAPGKHEWAIRQALAERGIPLVAEAADAEAVVIGTLSPGPMLDTAERRAAEPRIVSPWLPNSLPTPMGSPGLEPGTPAFSVLCSTN